MNRPRQQILTMIAITLTFGSGALDVGSFTRLGGVFTSVMTGNIVLGGLAVADRSVSLASHAAVSIAGYIIGVVLATRVAHGFEEREASRRSVLARHITWALLTELVLLAGFTGGWEAAGGDPAGWAEFCLLAVAAAAMGVQASAVRDMGMTDVSTTYLTGTLTGLVSSLAKPGQITQHGARRFGVLLGLLTGGLLSGLLIGAGAAVVVPVLPLTALVLALVLGSARDPDRACGGDAEQTAARPGPQDRAQLPRRTKIVRRFWW